MITDAPVSRAIEAWLVAWRGRSGSVVSERRECLLDAAGAHLATPLVALSALPAWRCAAMDGIAVDSAGGAGPVPAKQYTRVDTGQPVAARFDAVVPWERVTYAADGAATITGEVTTGMNVREAGEEVVAGSVILAAGTRLTPERIALAAACGHDHLDTRRARVAVIPTGDEVRPAGSVLARGEVADSNSVLLTLLARELGALVGQTPIVPDDPAALAEAVREAAEAADLVCVIAGSARGGRDHTRDAISAVGEVVVDGVAIRPGHPVVLGVVGRSLVIGVPGYPVSAAFTFRVFGEAAIAALVGAPTPSHATIVGRAAVDVFGHPSSACLIPVSVTDAAVTPLSRRGGALRSLAAADAVLSIAAGLTVRAGAAVSVELLRP